ELLLAHDRADNKQARTTLLRYALVVLHSFDQLTEKFQGGLRAGKFDGMGQVDSSRLVASLSKYHSVLDPLRSDLAAVRHTLGSHRGLPGPKEQKRFRNQFQAWGEWESTLASLETKCERSRWQPALEAAFELDRTINDVDLGQWYSTAENM